MATLPLRVHLFMDYQNVHLTAHETFGKPGAQPHTSLIHPGRFADAVNQARHDAKRDGVISRVLVFRGQPSQAHEPEQNRRNRMQASEWMRDRRVQVAVRQLKYPPAWPGEPAREKGVDVMLAANFIKDAALRMADVVILASRDTDLAAALEVASDLPNPPVIEVCNWAGSGRLASTRVKPWCTMLDENAYLQSLDPRQY